MGARIQGTVRTLIPRASKRKGQLGEPSPRSRRATKRRRREALSAAARRCSQSASSQGRLAASRRDAGFAHSRVRSSSSAPARRCDRRPAVATRHAHRARGPRARDGDRAAAAGARSEARRARWHLTRRAGRLAAGDTSAAGDSDAAAAVDATTSSTGPAAAATTGDSATDSAGDSAATASDAIDHGWLVKFVEHRIADRRVLRLIQKWLNAGVLEEGKRIRVEEGNAAGRQCIAAAGEHLPSLRVRPLGPGVAPKAGPRRRDRRQVCR